ncbi:hypothetical protein LCGC14_1380540 [marine sediment metagenome]|uniref:C2H2-type domain-containing protein n=1 Tax=marine sediment metagenome TaxID=412755 RepID=A0A0F9K3A5_9ZZZZ
MQPIDSVTNHPWSPKNSRLMLEQIKDEVRAELRARDASRGIPQLKDVHDDNGVKIGEKDNFQVYKDDGKVYAVDQHLASLKHSGRENRLMVQRRWAQFCSEPRDEVALSAKAGLTERQDELARTLDRTAEVADSDQPIGPVKSTPDLPMPCSDTDTAELGEPIQEFVCDQCDRKFTQRGHLTNHKKAHAREAVSV